MSIFDHQISVEAKGKRVPGWKQYNITTDLLTPADDFSLEVRFTREAWDLLRLDTEITISVDRVNVLTGFIGTREKTSDRSGGSMIRIAGRDKAGRLVDESAPLMKYGGKRLRDLARDIVGLRTSSPLFDEVRLQNTKNRLLVRDKRSPQAKTVKEPVLDETAGTFDASAGTKEVSQTGAIVAKPPKFEHGIFGGKASPKKVTPGMSRWAVLEKFAKEARLLCWCTADGKALVIAPPNYKQAAQYLFYEAAEGSPNANETNCSISYAEDIEDMYSKYIVLGSSRGTRSNHGKNVTKKRGKAFDNPSNTVDGVGVNFSRPKTLIIQDASIKSQRDASERAEREMLERAVSFREVTVEVAGHSQLYIGTRPTLYAVDTIARVVDEATGTNEDMYVTRVERSRSRGQGTTSTISLVPIGTLLQL